jgi:hypothetical protein
MRCGRMDPLGGRVHRSGSPCGATDDDLAGDDDLTTRVADQGGNQVMTLVPPRARPNGSIFRGQRAAIVEPSSRSGGENG